MAYVIFFAGLFLGTIFGFVLMALLALSSRASEPEGRQQRGVILPKGLLSHRKFMPFVGGQATGLQSLVLPRALKGKGAHAWGPGLWQRFRRRFVFS